MSAVATVTSISDVADEYLKGLGQRVRMWRLREGKSCFSMPSSLWDEVLAAGSKYRLKLVVQETGVSKDELKRRMGLPMGKGKASAVEAAAALEEEAQFIEAPGIAAALAAASTPNETPPTSIAAAPAPLTTTSDDAEGLSAAIVEVTTADGAKLSVRGTAAHLLALNIHSLVQHFRGAV